MKESVSKLRIDAVFFTMKARGERSDGPLQAMVPVWFQTLLMEIPRAPSRSGFGCRATGPQVPPPPTGRAGMASNS